MKNRRLEDRITKVQADFLSSGNPDVIAYYDLVEDLQDEIEQYEDEIEKEELETKRDSKTKIGYISIDCLPEGTSHGDWTVYFIDGSPLPQDKGIVKRAHDIEGWVEYENREQVTIAGFRTFSNRIYHEKHDIKLVYSGSNPKYQHFK